MTDNFDQSDAGDRYLIQSNALSGWFLGPRAENRELFNELINQTITQHQQNRRKYWPTDPEYITRAQKWTPAYKAEKKQLKDKLKEMNDDLKMSTPVFSPRFQGHMNWDISMPAVLGYISGMVWNPNNVDVTASPITTPYEIIAADQICDMIGFDRSKIEPWGHITCGGSIANIEAVWSSRNMKFYPLSLQDAVMAEAQLAGAKTYKVNVPAKPDPQPRGDQPFVQEELQNCSVWQLLNLDVDDACSMAEGVAGAAGVSMDILSGLVHPYAYTSIGIYSFLQKHSINSPKLFVPATCHYSWPKAATVLGLGEDNLIHINVTALARQDMNHLREELQKCVTNAIPVISVTAVMGSTEESAIDPLTEILAMREEFKMKGLNFAVLADAAWGAYMRTMLIDPDSPEEQEKARRRKEKQGREQRERNRSTIISKYVPIAPLSKHATDNLNALRHADTVTSDPHKTGYVPYPAGGLSYRNGTMKDFVLLAAPEVFHSEDDLSVGVNGLEGSKPGAAGAGVLLSHRVIGMDKYGYGRILGQCVYGSKIYYCMWLHLSKPTDPFIIKPYIPCSDQDKELAKNLIIGKSNLQIVTNSDAMALLDRVGPDCMINKFGINLIIDDVKNNDVDLSTEYSKKNWTNSFCEC
ncbi:group II decarboxylase family [Paramuricea clavata]|uniref:Group II decarboxylase family n=1 Tax=Paramuricea clavata TaxID=317549 RepID=A0A6S7GWE3_PARCT|nr:group II decarboxylase family [Paramuricea clavata]